MIVADSLRVGSVRQVALVTGASGTIGRCVAAQLAAAGYLLILQHRGDGAELKADVEAMRSQGVDAVSVRADLSSPEEVAKLGAFVSERFGGLDALVHAATGPVSPSPPLLTCDADFLAHLQVQTVALGGLLRTLLPLMQRQQAGVIIGFLSTVLEAPRPKRWWAYSSAKFALLGLLSGLSTDVEGSGVRVVGVMPSGVASTLSQAAGVAQTNLLEADDVAALVRKIALEPKLFPNGTIARLGAGSCEVGRMVFSGKPVQLSS